MNKPSNAELKRSFDRYLVTRQFSRSTYKRYQKIAVEWLDHLGHKRRNALDATYEDALEFWSALQARYGCSALRSSLSILHTFYKWLQIDHVVRDPFAWVERPKPDEPKMRPIVGPEELVMLVVGWTPVTWSDHRDRAAVAIYVSTGCRREEAMKMSLPDWDTRKGAIFIRGKGKKAGWGALLPAAAQVVREYVNVTRPLRAKPGETALVINNRGTRAKAETIGDIVRRTSEAIGTDVHLTPHGIRASAITAVYEASHDAVAAQDFARHKNIQTTVTHYIQRSPLRAIEVAAAFHPLAHAATMDESPPT